MYEDRARKGAELLDRANPGWAWRIATDRLAMTSCSRCVLGQLYGSYDRGIEAIGFAEDVHGGYEASDAHGFHLDLVIEEPGGVSYAEMQRRYMHLADAWRAEIRARAGGFEGSVATERGERLPTGRDWNCRGILRPCEQGVLF